jgi:hypothetical protein
VRAECDDADGVEGDVHERHDDQEDQTICEKVQRLLQV